MMTYRCVAKCFLNNKIIRSLSTQHLLRETSSTFQFHNRWYCSSYPPSLPSAIGKNVDKTEDNILTQDLDSKTNVLTLTLNHPKTRNALSTQMLNKLSNAIDDAQANKCVRAIVIQASGGKVFSSGHDLKEIISFQQKNNEAAEMAQNDNVTKQRQHIYNQYLDLFQLCSKVMTKITEIEKPVIAKVDGIATAAGCQLVASCDLAIATDRSKFATPGVNIGLFCSTPAVAITRLIGKRNAMKMLLTGDMISAKEAKDIGLINDVVLSSLELNTVVTDLAEKIASKSPTSIAIGKSVLKEQLSCGNNVNKAYDIASNAMAKNLMELDAKEGIDAFLNKRSPVWPSTIH